MCFLLIFAEISLQALCMEKKKNTADTSARQRGK